MRGAAEVLGPSLHLEPAPREGGGKEVGRSGTTGPHTVWRSASWERWRLKYTRRYLTLGPELHRVVVELQLICKAVFWILTSRENLCQLIIELWNDDGFTCARCETVIIVRSY